VRGREENGRFVKLCTHPSLEGEKEEGERPEEGKRRARKGKHPATIEQLSLLLIVQTWAHRRLDVYFLIQISK
jgi:hypothetical protein